MFLLFEAASGLKVNLAKSVLIPVGNVEDVSLLADILGCGIASLPVKYLGMLCAFYIFLLIQKKSILVCHWGPRIRLNIFGMIL